jgi:putative hydrolase of the HAD superfamily
MKAVTFDFWKTLFFEGSYEELRVIYLRNVMNDLGIKRSLEEIAEAYESTHDYVHRVWAEEGYRHVPARERVDLMLRKLGVTVPESLKEKIIEYFEETILERPPRLKEGARETLENLHEKFKLGIICDTGMTPGRVMRMILEDAGILRFFESTVFSDEVGFNKPHRLIFERALNELGVKPQEAIHVGDLHKTDIVGAKGIGMKAVWIRQDKGESTIIGCRADYEIESLPELVEILEKIG